jgi:four helix bundle protein
MGQVQSFEELECWKASRKFRMRISALCKKFPAEERYGLSSQILRSSRSVCDNVAEGFGRFHYQENSQFCRQARGSLYEAFSQCITAKDEGFITDSEFEEIVELYQQTKGLLNGYINYLQRAKLEMKTTPNP